MIQGYDPRTAEPVGEPVAETTDAQVDEIVAWAVSAAPVWGAGTALAKRAEALEAVADALDARAGELAVIADTGSDASAALHRRFGFTEVGTFHEYAIKNGQYLSSLWMELRL